MEGTQERGLEREVCQPSFRQFILEELGFCGWHHRQFVYQEFARFQPYQSLHAKEGSQAVYEYAIMCASIWFGQM